MVSLVVRKSTRGLLSYFEHDFDSAMWIDEKGFRHFVPRIGGLRPGEAAVRPWLELLPEQFRELVREVGSERKNGGVLALEWGFAGPKSVSIAGLADERLTPVILQAHTAAVDDALAFLSPLLVARAGGKLVGCGIRLMRFDHPWNRASEPQLHSHILMLREFDFTHALWTTPLFLLQRTVREVYHYSLCSRLIANGYAVELDEAGNLAWELAGVPSNLLAAFSERSKSLKELARKSPQGFFSQGAEFRVAGLISRRLLPRSDPSVSLGKARSGWRELMPPLMLAGSRARIEVGPIALDHAFRLSSVLTRQQFIGTHLRWWLGASLTLAEAVVHAGNILDTHVNQGRVLGHGRAYCLPHALETEDRILQILSAGFIDGPRLKVASAGFRAIAPCLELPHRVKVIGTDGAAAPMARDLRKMDGSLFEGRVITLGRWNSGTVLQTLQATHLKPVVVIFEEPFATGDFGAQVIRIQMAGSSVRVEPDLPFWWKSRQLLVRQGNVTKALMPGRKSGLWKRIRQWLTPAEDSLAGRPGVVVAPGLSDDHLRDLAWQRLLRTAGPVPRPIEMCRPVPWVRLFTNQEWEGLGLFAFRTETLEVAMHSPKLLRTIRHGMAWFFTGPPEAGMIPVTGVKRTKFVSLHPLEAAIGRGYRLALVERVPIQLRPGIPLASPVRFESNGQVFCQGHIFVVDRVDEAGVVHFLGGHQWPSPHLVMEPAFFVRAFQSKQPKLPVIVVQAEMGFSQLKSIVSLPPAGLTELVTPDSRELCQAFTQELALAAKVRSSAARNRAKEGNWMAEDLRLLFPSPKKWRCLQAHSSIGEGLSVPTGSAASSEGHEIPERISVEETLERESHHFQPSSPGTDKMEQLSSNDPVNEEAIEHLPKPPKVRKAVEQTKSPRVIDVTSTVPPPHGKKQSAKRKAKTKKPGNKEDLPADLGHGGG